MRKHFLLLFMAFMSLTAFAENIYVVPTVIDKAYGEVDPGSAYGGYDATDNPNGVKTTMFYVASPAVLPGEVTAERIAKCLKVVRVANSTGEAVGSYKYLFQVDLSQDGALSGHQIIVQSNGDLNINKAEVVFTGLEIADGGWTYGEEAKSPTLTSAMAGTVNVTSQVAYTYAKETATPGTYGTPGTYADIVNGQAGNYKVIASVADANYDGEAEAVFSIAKRPVKVEFGAGPFEITYGEAAPNWGLTFTKVAPLTTALANDADATQFAVIKNDGTPLPTAAAADPYTVKVVDNSGNYEITPAATAAYTINFKPINSTSVAILNATALPAKVYKAEAWTLTTEDSGVEPDITLAELQVFDGETRLIKGTDFNVAYENNTNAGTATVTITGAGNYATSATNKLTATFEITKAPLNVALTAPAQNIAYGGVWDATVAIPDTDWKDVAHKTAFGTAVGADPTLMPTAAIPAEADYDADGNLTAGEHIVTISGGTAPDNYQFVYATTNKVTVGKATITISLKTDATTDDLQWNGTATATDFANAMAHAYKLSVDLDPAAVFSVQPTVVSTAAVAAEYVPATYAIAFQAHDAVIASAFADKYTLAWDDTPQSFTITKKALTITALNQAVAKVADADDSDFSDDTDGDAYDVTYTIEGFAEGENLADASINLTALEIDLAVGVDLTVAGVYANGIEISGATSDFYNINYVFGNLTVAGNGIALTLPFTDEAADIIAAADGSEDVAVSFEEKTMKIGEWYAMVLPFDVDPLKMVQAFDRYVIFNELNVAGTTAGNFKFTLKLNTIPAGTPFLIKFAPKDGDAADAVVNWNAFSALKYGNVTISSEIHPVETAYVVFTGSYASNVELQGSRTNGSENYVWWLCDTRYERSTRVNDWLKPISKPHKVAPMEAWLDGNESAWTGYAPIITVEDFDGQTTSIQTLNAGEINGLNVANEGWYTINGIKLDAKPTEKGIYIFNGKKVAIQ